MANSEIAGKLYDMLKIKLGRESHTHTEIINEARNLALLVLHARTRTLLKKLLYVMRRTIR